MKGRILQIHPVKAGGRYPVDFQRVTFDLEDGGWGATDICPAFHNAKHWKGKVELGQVLGNLQWKNQKNHILDADYEPTPLPPDDFHPPVKPEKPPDPQISLL